MSRVWKFLKFEWKKYLWALLILTAVCTLPYIVELSTMELSYTYMDYEGKLITVIHSSKVGLSFLALGALCFLSPALVYSFKMSKRGVDGYYALPLKKQKLYLVKTVVGLLLALIPFTVMFWSGFLTLLCRADNPYDMFWYLPAYWGGVLFGISLFGFNAFLYTRGNTAVDGLCFMVAYIPFFLILYEYAANVFNMRFYDYYESFLTFGGLMDFGNKIDRLIIRHLVVKFSPLTFVVMPLLGAVGYALLFALLPCEKAENAEQVSESVFGYKTLIPVYTALLLALNWSAAGWIGMIGVAVGAIVATVAFRRKFNLEVKWWGWIVVALAVGLLLSVPIA